MEIKIKKLREDAIVPVYAKEGDAGLDLTAVNSSMDINLDGSAVITYHSGIAVEIPEGYVGLLFPRSSIYKKSLNMTNCVGVIDSGYRGEVMAKFKINTMSVPHMYDLGERFAQLIIMPYPKVTFKLVDELSTTDRGEDGHGSTDENTEQSENIGFPKEEK